MEYLSRSCAPLAIEKTAAMHRQIGEATTASKKLIAINQAWKSKH